MTLAHKGGHSGDQIGKMGLKGLLGYLAFVELTSGFTQGFYTPLIPSVAEHLDVGSANIIWFMTLQTLAAAVAVPLLSKLGDMFGHRLLLRIALGVVLAGTVITALSPTFAFVLVGRVLTGPIAVWLPLEIAIVHSRVTGDEARSSIGVLVSTLTGGAILGTVASGAVSSVLPSLPLVLLTPSVLVALAFGAALFKIPESTAGRLDEKVDGLGFLGLAIAMILLMSSLKAAEAEGFGHILTIGGFVAAAVVLGVWAWWERRVSYPAIDVRLVVSKTLGPVYLTGFLFGMIMFGIQAPLTTFLSAPPAIAGYGFDAQTTVTSAVIATFMVMATAGAAGFAGIARRIGMKSLQILAATLAGGGSLFAMFFHAHLWNMFVYAVVAGLGMGFLLGSLPAVVSELAPANQKGVATGVYNSLLALGGATAGAVFAVILGLHTPEGAEYPSVSGYVVIWGISVGAFVISALALSGARIPKEVDEEA